MTPVYALGEEFNDSTSIGVSSVVGYTFCSFSDGVQHLHDEISNAVMHARHLCFRKDNKCALNYGI